MGVPLTKKRADKNFIGAAGEHLVLSRLYARRVLASLAPPNTPEVDILVNPIDGNNSKLIQVKSTESSGKDRGWSMRDEHLSLVSPKLFYCFVELSSNPQNVQNVYVIPSGVVAQVLKEADKAYMNKPQRDGSARTKHSRRMLKPNFLVDIPSAPVGWMGTYLERWDLLKNDE